MIIYPKDIVSYRIFYTLWIAFGTFIQFGLTKVPVQNSSLLSPYVGVHCRGID
jgi:hypothetical protein